MTASYAEARIVADAQEACMSYGLVRGSDRYDRCVQREVAYRRPSLARATHPAKWERSRRGLRSRRHDPSN